MTWLKLVAQFLLLVHVWNFDDSAQHVGDSGYFKMQKRYTIGRFTDIFEESCS